MRCGTVPVFITWVDGSCDLVGGIYSDAVCVTHSWWSQYYASLLLVVELWLTIWLIFSFFVFLFLYNVNVRDKFSNWTFSFGENSIIFNAPLSASFLWSFSFLIMMVLSYKFSLVIFSLWYRLWCFWMLTLEYQWNTSIIRC